MKFNISVPEQDNVQAGSLVRVTINNEYGFFRVARVTLNNPHYGRRGRRLLTVVGELVGLCVYEPVEGVLIDET